MIVISLLGGIAAVGIAVILRELYIAPEGYEDETGFHVLWQNNRQDIADVSCLWLPTVMM